MEILAALLALTGKILTADTIELPNDTNDVQLHPVSLLISDRVRLPIPLHSLQWTMRTVQGVPQWVPVQQALALRDIEQDALCTRPVGLPDYWTRN